MKFKFTATFLLVLLLIGVYIYFAKGFYYLDQSTLISFSSFSNTLPFGLVTHFLVHVSPSHLIGNLIFLIVFGLVLENKVSKLDYFLILLASMIVSSFIFILLNPESYLVGASLGIAGIFGAVLALRPVFGITLLLLFFLVSPFLISPFTSFFKMKTLEQQSSLEVEKQSLVSKIKVLNQQNKSAFQEETQLNHTLQSLNKIEVFKELEKAPSNTFAHLVSFLIGFSFIAFFKKQAFWRTKTL